MRKTALLRHFDSFQNGGWCKVDGDIDHTYSTQQYVTGKFIAEFRLPRDDIYDPDWYDDIEAEEKGYAHLPFEYDGDDDAYHPKLEVRRRTLNRSIASLRIIPEQCSNVQECRPIEQDVLLPYLTDASNVNRFERVTTPYERIPLVDGDFAERLSNGAYAAPARAAFVEDSDYRYYPTEQSCFFISQSIADPGADAAEIAQESMTALNYSQNQTVLTRMHLYTDPGPAVAGNLAYAPSYHDDENAGDDGLHGLPFKHLFGHPEAPIPANIENFKRDVYQLNLEHWKVSVDVGVFNQIGAGALNRFEFKFPNDSKLELVFGKNGRATTQNASPNAIPDTEAFHVFQIWDKNAHGLENPGNADPQAYADYLAGIPYGDMVRPLASDAALCEQYNGQLDAGTFPLELADPVQTLYLYMPIRRYARKSLGGHPEPCSQLSRYYAPRKYGGDGFDEVSERHNAMLAWLLRASVQPLLAPENTHIFRPGVPLKDYLGKTIYGQVLPGFNEVDGTNHLRDFNYQLSHMILQGQIADWMNAIRQDFLIDAATKYSFVLRFRTHTSRNVMGVFPDEPELIRPQEPRYEIVVFKKSDIVLHRGQICLAHSAWKMPFDLRQLYSHATNPNTVALTLFNNGAVNPLRLGHLLESTHSIVRGFNDITRFEALPDAILNMDRPNVAAPNAHSPFIAFNYSVADGYYTNDPPNGAYYQKVAGNVPLLHEGQPDYELPRQPPLWRTAGQNVELAHAVNADVADPRMDTIVESLTADVFFFEDDSRHFRLGDLPVVNNWPLHEVTLKESLLGFYGMSPYLPSSIYPILKQFPPFLQSFVYNFRRESPPNCARVVREDGYGGIDNYENISTHLIPTGEVKLTLESYNSFDQADKELEVVDLPWPKFEVFTSVSA